MQDESNAGQNALIHVEGLRKSYHAGTQSVSVLNGITLRIERGEFVAIMGASGSGKSTLLNVLGLLDNFGEGEYRLAGQSTRLLGERASARLRNRLIGFVFQSFHLLPQKNAWENVALPLSYRNVSRRIQRKRAHEMLERLSLSHRADHRPNEMSGGQRQRVAIARALVTDPPLVLADEPTGNLDSETSDEVLRLLGGIHAEGRTVVLVTHELDVAHAAQRLIHVRDGLIDSDERLVRA
ncbi:MAG: ABC transporter ATP-binding protein [Polyangiales bacterium]